MFYCKEFERNQGSMDGRCKQQCDNCKKIEFPRTPPKIIDENDLYNAFFSGHTLGLEDGLNKTPTDSRSQSIKYVRKYNKHFNG